MNDVRKIMEATLFGIDESEGLTNRKPDDAFKNEAGEIIKFVKMLDKVTIDEYMSLNSSPEGVTVDPLSEESLKKFIAGWHGKPIDNIKIIKPKTKIRGQDILMVAIFTDPNGNPIAFVKIGKGSGVSWGNQDFGRETGFLLQKTASTSETLPIKMTDVYPMADKSENPNLLVTVEQFVADIIKYTETASLPPNLAEGIRHLLTSLMSDSGGGIVIPFCSEYEAVFMKYIGEMVAPICLYKNKLVLSADTPINEIYADFGDATAPFSPSSSKLKIYRTVHTRIIDSKLVDATGKQMGISSKAKGGGADASVDILYDTIKKMESSGMESELTKMKEDKVIDIITIIRNNHRYFGPVLAAKALGIFDQNGASDLYDLFAPLASTKNTKEAIGSIEKVIDINKYPFIANYNFKPEVDNPGYSKTYHVISVLARMVCDVMNTQHNVGEHIKFLLSRKSLVQAYANFTKTKKSPDLIFNGVKIVYPAKMPRNILMTAKKPYSASYINGKITFKVPQA